MRPPLSRSLIGWCLLSILPFASCTHSSQPSASSFSVSGKTYLVGSTEPTSRVLVTCAGVTSTSDTMGNYELRGIPEGKQILRAERSDLVAYFDTIDVKTNTKRDIYLTLKPSKTCRIWGYVSNVVDGPISGATVRMRDSVVFSDVSGRYDLPPMLYGSDTLFVSRNNYLSFATVVTLDSSQKRINVSLLRQVIIFMKVTEDAYVDEGRAADNYGLSSTLLLSSNATGQTGNQKNIYIKWVFPDTLRDERKQVFIAGIQLLLSSPVPTSSVQTYSIASSWSAASITYLTQPTRGALLETTTTGQFDRLYWYALTTPSINQLIADWKSNRPFYGIVIQGGPSSGTPAAFNSSKGLSYPRLLLVLQY